MDTSAFDEQVVMIARSELRNTLKSVVAIHIEDDNVVSSHSVNFESGADLFAIIGALEAMKHTLLLKYHEQS